MRAFRLQIINGVQGAVRERGQAEARPRGAGVQTAGEGDAHTPPVRSGEIWGALCLQIFLRTKAKK